MRSGLFFSHVFTLTNVDMLSSHGLDDNEKCQTHEEHGRVHDQGVKNNGDTFS